jgi:hypothetical protein
MNIVVSIRRTSLGADSVGYREHKLGRLLALLASVLMGKSLANGQAPTELRHASRNEQIKTWFKQQWTMSATDAEKLETLRGTIRQGPYSGQRVLVRMFQNLEGEFAVNPNIPGLGQLAQLAAFDNESGAKGARRTFVYGLKLNADSRFEWLSVNERYANSLGKSDIDIKFEHRSTYRIGHLESKELTAASQRADLRRISRQIQMMAEEQSKGQLVAWVNRRPNIPEVEALGRKYRVPVYGGVATGQAASKSGNRPIESVFDDLDRRATRFQRAFGSGAQLGFGLYQLVVSGQQFWNEMELLLDADRAENASALRLGQSGSLAVGGGLLAVSGGIKAGQALAGIRKLDSVARWASKLSGLSKWSGRFGTGATLIAGRFVAHEYYRGRLTDRQMSRITVGMVGGTLGSAGGAWAIAYVGAGIGALIAGPVGTTVGGAIGGIAGAIGGGWAGDALFTYGIDSQLQLRDKEMEKQRVAAIYAYYEVRNEPNSTQ